MIYNRLSILLTFIFLIVCAKLSFSTNNLTKLQCENYHIQIDSLLNIKDYVSAHNLSHEVLSQYNGSPEGDIVYYEICNNISKSNYYLGNITQAELYAEKTLKELISQISSLIYCTKDKRSTITNKIIPILQWSQSLLLISKNKHYNNLIYDVALNIKNLLLKSDSEFIKNASTLTEEDFEITDIYYNPDSLHRTLEEKAIVYSNIATFFPNFTSFTRINFEDITTSLTEIDVAIEFVENVIDRSIYALVLRNRYKSPNIIRICPIDTLLQSLNLGFNLYAKNHSCYLYDTIWGKLEAHFNHEDNIFFSPTNILHQINIEILQDDNGKFINEKYNLYRLSSTRELSIIQPEIKYNSAALYGGLNYDMDTISMLTESKNLKYSLNIFATRAAILYSSLRSGLKTPHASIHEVTNIKKILETNNIIGKIYSEDNGTEESFKALSDSLPSIIHLATHGFYYTEKEVSESKFFSQYSIESPLNRAGIILSGAKKAWLGKEVPKEIDDGILLAKEVELMNLNGTGLLVLSACQTGLGEITAESIYGLQRSFKMAGVQTIIMSLWEINDNVTEEFMILFYTKWVKNKNKQQAFNEAVIEIKNKYYDLSPQLWAGFIMLDAFD